MRKQNGANANGRGTKRKQEGEQERMKETFSGLTYNGETAPFSNFFHCDIRYVVRGESRTYFSLEQAYAHIKCVVNNDEEREKME